MSAVQQSICMIATRQVNSMPNTSQRFRCTGHDQSVFGRQRADLVLLERNNTHTYKSASA
jgi:hypothetical protein